MRLPLRHLLTLLFLACFTLGSASCGKKSNATTEEDTSPTAAQLLLTQAQGLARLELATVRIKVSLRIDPHRDGIFGFKKLFGSKETRLELRSQASVFCDLRQLSVASIRQRPDSVLELTLPRLEIRREFDDVDQRILQEPTGLRRKLSTNELNDFIQSKQSVIDQRFESALDRYRPALIRKAYETVQERLLPIFRQLGREVHLYLDPEDASLLETQP